MADIVNLTIDDQKVAVPKGTLIVDAATSVGIKIPVFCSHKKLHPVGACRMCLVEIGTPRRNPDGTMPTNPDGTPVIAFMPKPQTSCTTPVSEGMVVRTKSPAVIKAQKGILEFLLINHPLDCPVCDKGGECPLQDQTLQFGPGKSRFQPDDKQHFVKPIDLSERIALDRERCVMCFRCTRFQDEIAGDPQIDVFERGARSEIGVVPGQVWDSNFSGNTIELCPVGALTSKEFRFRARAWEMQNVESVCSRCAVGCNVTLQVRSNQVLRILARENDEVNEVWICDRGRFDYEYLNEDRLLEPKLERGNRHEEIGWSTAQATVVEALRGVIAKHGAQAVGGLASPRLTNEDLYVFQKFMHNVVGTQNVDYRTAATPDRGGHMSMAISDLEKQQGILVVGSDVFDELPVLGLRVRKAAVHGQAKLVVAYPRPNKLAADAALWLKHGEGADLALLKALLSAARSATSPDLCSEAGVTVQQVDDTVKLLSGRTPSVILYGARLGANEDGAAVLAALTDLAAALGATVHGLSLEANGQGARDMGCTPGASGLSGAAMLAAAAEGRLKALWLAGADVLAGVDEALLDKALANLELLIVQDSSPSAASQTASVLLPGFSFAEAEGTYTNVERRVQRLRPALTPAGHMRANWQIVAQIATEMGASGFGYATSGDVLAEIAAAVPGYAGLTYSGLGKTGKRI
jgi:NADH-quinone oxidoreductase subunit G